MLVGIWTHQEKAGFIRFQMRLKTLLKIKLGATHVSFGQEFVHICPCPEHLWETEFKSGGQINLMGRISK